MSLFRRHHHDWRQPPEGWSKVLSFFNEFGEVKPPAGVEFQAITDVCASCGESRGRTRRVPNVNDWPKAES